MERWVRRAKLARRWVIFLGCAMILCPALTRAQEGAEPSPDSSKLTLARALDLGRQRAPSIVAERLRIGEARGRLIGASPLLHDNPVIEGGAGYRWAPAGESTVEGRAALSQSFELGGQRAARVAGARAQVARAEALSRDEIRRVLREVGLAFVHALHSRDRLGLARSIEHVSEETQRVSERRHASGDIARLDLTLARASLARARAEVRAAEASREQSLAELRLSLGLSPDEAIDLEGKLSDRPAFDLSQLERHASQRADLNTLEAEVREARSDRDLGAATRWPDLGIGASYERHENADILLGTASLTLPVFQRGQGLVAEAEARGQRLATELRARRNAVTIQVRAAFAIYDRRFAAVQELEQGTLPLLDESEAQVRQSYESGQLSLTDFLAVRREIVATRIEYTDRLLDAAVAAVELTASAGAFEVMDVQRRTPENPPNAAIIPPDPKEPTQ